ncbi:RNA polymerase sigma-70 factor (ECF subfamily) [Chitinophaga skermanii]|uniref:RNA polymerase sigma-70 factor (ECF subfamily) n=1 Tax=Chitinophaga skermanii TaxID=331697 RepID=A0A327QZ14_9BACT|nr:sigma-70 family RNA polymerase sigma factor [Chitinophaga skermanii]RAJ08882.1 RNA polymerase sigma-70 factor (ECF subfamily) [Chitinophaga skermanii]
MHNNLQEESALLQSFAAGDEQAFSVIYQRFYKGLMVFALRFVESTTAEDIIAETFIKLWQTKNEFQSLGQLHQWLRITLRNACLNHIRQDKNASERQQELLYLSDEAIDYQFSTAHLYANLHTRIIQEIEKMPKQQQTILKLFFVEEMSNADIAQQLNISVQAVKNQKVTALKVLRKTFKDEELWLFTGLVSTFMSHFSK